MFPPYDALKEMVERHGIRRVLNVLGAICKDKSLGYARQTGRFIALSYEHELRADQLTKTIRMGNQWERISYRISALAEEILF